MTKDEIIETAVQAGMYREVLTLGRNVELLTAFAKLVAQHEREACANVCDKTANNPNEWAYERSTAEELATAIRARGQA